jgi:hypothetical protein
MLTTEILLDSDANISACMRLVSNSNEFLVATAFQLLTNSRKNIQCSGTGAVMLCVRMSKHTMRILMAEALHSVQDPGPCCRTEPELSTLQDGKQGKEDWRANPSKALSTGAYKHLQLQIVQ